MSYFEDEQEDWDRRCLSFLNWLANTEFGRDYDIAIADAQTGARELTKRKRELDD